MQILFIAGCLAVKSLIRVIFIFPGPTFSTLRVLIIFKSKVVHILPQPNPACTHLVTLCVRCSAERSVLFIITSYLCESFHPDAERKAGYSK